MNVNLSLDSDDVAILMKGKMITKVISNNRIVSTPDDDIHINIIAVDDGVDVYVKKIHASFKEVLLK